WKPFDYWDSGILWDLLYIKLLRNFLLGFCRCYAVALLEDRKYSKIAPLGGFAFIAAWGSLLF
ncbi:hypothetical protein GIB67_011193, partial [Kingdonia uniflora]